MTEGHTMKHLTLPLTPEAIASLRAGDEVLLTGWLYTGRDAAHKRLAACLSAGESTPFPLEGETIYYVGPAPARPGQVIGPAGPTSSYRMDPYTPALLEHGLKCMIGKGRRSPEVTESIVKNHAVYLLTIGGTAALTAQSIYKKEPVCYDDLGTEAVCRLYVQDFYAIVGIDCHGGAIV